MLSQLHKGGFMNLPTLLLGATLTYWGLTLLGILALNSKVLGILALVTGVAYLVLAFGVSFPTIGRRG